MISRLELYIMRDLLAGDMTLKDAQLALRDPDAWKKQRKGFTYNGVRNLNRWGLPAIVTPRMTVRYIWYRHRNRAGYFVGYREAVDRSGRKKIDQLVARKSKKRLVELLRRKSAALTAKYPPAPKEPRRVSTPRPLDPRIDSIDGSSGDWFVYLKDGYQRFDEHGFHLDDKRRLSALMADVEACACSDCQ